MSKVRFAMDARAAVVALFFRSFDDELRSFGRIHPWADSGSTAGRDEPE